uniref:Uncharacterized protein n=1 Tax=Lygus hesperus TaxID=30085 RepID=A0A0A9WHL8_LYGHE
MGNVPDTAAASRPYPTTRTSDPRPQSSCSYRVVWTTLAGGGTAGSAQGVWNRSTDAVSVQKEPVCSTRPRNWHCHTCISAPAHPHHGSGSPDDGRNLQQHSCMGS